MAAVAVAAVSNRHYCPASLPINPTQSSFLRHLPSRLGKSRFAQNVQDSVHTCKNTSIKALFGRPRKALEPPDTDFSLGHFTLTGETLEAQASLKVFLFQLYLQSQRFLQLNGMHAT